jgi:hypothetical protein
MKLGTIVFLLAALAGAAHAQSSGAQAETLFRQGKDLIARGKIAEACAAFDASQKLEPAVSTLLNQAACREKNGQLATAWGEFIEAERQTRNATDDATRQLHQTAASHAARLEPRLSTLAITVPAENRVGGLQVLRGGEPVDPGAWNRALPVDGGTYKITATAPGNAEWSSMVSVGNERDVKTIEIPRLKAAALGPPRVGTGAEGPRPGPIGRAGSAEPPRSRLVPYALGGGAIALAGGAIGLELWARSTYDQSKTEVDNARQTSLWHSANTRRYVAEGLGVASLACASAAVWLYLRAGAEEAPPGPRAARLHVAPMVARSGGGVMLGWY